MRPMGVDLGITAAAFGFSIALQNIVWGVAQPFSGALADRYGPRPVIAVTALIFSAGLLTLMMSTTFPGGLVLAGVLWASARQASWHHLASRRPSATGGPAAAAGLRRHGAGAARRLLIDGPGWRAAMMTFAGLAKIY